MRLLSFSLSKNVTRCLTLARCGSRLPPLREHGCQIQGAEFQVPADFYLHVIFTEQNMNGAGMGTRSMTEWQTKCSRLLLAAGALSSIGATMCNNGIALSRKAHAQTLHGAQRGGYALPGRWNAVAGRVSQQGLYRPPPQKIFKKNCELPKYGRDSGR